MASDFVHLHLHTEFSLVDSVVRIAPLMPAVAASMAAVAITDSGNLMGGVKFYRAALRQGLKPVLGVDAWIGDEPGAEPYRQVLLATDDNGYKNLCELISAGYQRGQRDGRPVLARDWLTARSTAGVIALSGARHGDVGRALIRGAEDEAQRRLSAWRALFGDRYYLELQRTGRADEDAHNAGAVELAVATGTPVVATNDVVMISPDQFDSHEARVCINQGRVLADPERPRAHSEQQYLRSCEEMAELFADLPAAIENSVEIARRCNAALSLGTPVLPDFPIPAGLSEAAYFCHVSREGLVRRLEQCFEDPDLREQQRPTYEQRLEVELDVINGMGFAGYFLIVADFIQWSKDNDIPVGPGRGSGAGSLVAYALSITDIDPLPYDLLFERFLNPERVSMPDFDVDFCMDGRDRVIQYVAEKYGTEKVSQIITYGTMAAKAVVRDCGRILGHPYGMVDGISKLVPFEVGMTLTKALEQSEDLKRRYDEDEEVHELIDLALSLEGLARNAGKHAGGVVIAPSGLTDFCPLYCEADGSSLVTQFDKDDAEAVGLVKFDFLGLRTLTIIDNALKTINAAREDALDMAQVPLDDGPTFKLLQRADTTAVFQLESRGMKDLIKRLQPDNFEDIIALVALFRPGPLQSGMVDDFINRKHGRAPLAYPHPDYQLDALKPVLHPTYGIILYQEQVMQIAQVMAGYSLGGADLLRRAMGKKKPEEMAKQKKGFVEGSLAQGIEAALAEKIFDLVEKFAGYGFNKSHSAAYALVSYQTAWLKCHYPAEFMAAVLSSDMDNTDKVVLFVRDCLSMGLKLAPPDINLSALHFTVESERCIRFGLGAVKGVGEAALSALLDERSRGPFADLADLCRRSDPGKLNRRVLEALIRAGALDALGSNRNSLLHNLDAALKAAEQEQRNHQAGMMDLFAESTETAAPVHYAQLPPAPEREILAAEKACLGLYLSGHPIDSYLDELQHLSPGRIAAQCAKVKPAAPGQKYSRGTSAVIAGMVESQRVISGQRGKRVLLTLDDNSGTVEASLDAELYDSARASIRIDELLIVEGELSWDDFSGGHRLRVQQVLDLPAARARYARRLDVYLRGEHCFARSMANFAAVLERHNAGRCPVVIHYRNGEASARLALGERWCVRPADELLEQLAAIDDVDIEIGY